MKDRLKTVLSWALAALFVVGGASPPSAVAADAAQEEGPPPSEPSHAETIFVEIAKRMTPAVVNLSTVSLKRELDHPSADNSFFRKFFGEEPFRRKAQERVQGMGSGVIIDPDGYIITNHHVIADAKEIRVVLNDRREFPGKVVGSDVKSDIAVVKVEAKELPFARWGDSSGLKVGEYALAIGNSFGLTETVTLGIISAVGRANVGIADYEDFIQTDAPINPGNSGGALVNIRGELIGVNTAIFSEGGGSLGIGFAIPSNMAKPVMESLIKTGRVVRGSLGLAVQGLTLDLAKEFGLTKPEGVLIGDILPNSPAGRAGLRRGDIILAVDGKTVESTGQFRNIVASAPVGSRLKMILFREGRRQEVVAAIEEQPSEGAVQQERPPEKKATSAPSSGIGVRELTPALLEQLHLSKNQQGVMVEGVAPGSGADEAGLQEGDIIMEINRRALKNVKEYEEAVSKMTRDQTALLLINRGGRTFFMAVRPS